MKLARLRIASSCLLAFLAPWIGCDCAEAPNVGAGVDAVECSCLCGVQVPVTGTIVCEIEEPPPGQCPPALPGFARTDFQCAIGPFAACIPPDIGANPIEAPGDLSADDIKAVCDRACSDGAVPLAQNFTALTENLDPDDDPNTPECDSSACEIVCIGVVGRVVDAEDGVIQPPIDRPGDAVFTAGGNCTGPDAGVRPDCRSEPCPNLADILDAGISDEDIGEVLQPVLEECTYTEDDPGECGGRPSTPVCLEDTESPTSPRVPVGFMHYLVGNISVGEIDTANSTVQVSANGGPDGGVPATVTGRVSIAGRPCPGSSCAVGLFAAAAVEPLSLSFTVADVPGSVYLSEIAITAKTPPAAVSLNGDGDGVLCGDDLSGIARAHAAPSVAGFLAGDVAFDVHPVDDVNVQVRFGDKTFQVSGLVETAENLFPPRPAMVVDFTLRGTLVSQPPVARAGEDQVVQCSSHDGAVVEFDGTGTVDADADIIGAAWFRGEVFTPQRRVGTGLVGAAQQSLGRERYLLLVGDSRRQLDRDTVDIEVADTLAPRISGFANNGPACVWSPHHDYVVLRVGAELTAVVEDDCDPNPELVIIEATSDQPDDAIGDGNTSNDVVLYPDHVCLRAERSGVDPDGRTYTVRMIARDASGNESDPSFQVRVVHDQDQHDCPRLAADLFVDDGDALCESPRAPAPIDEHAHVDIRGGSASCASGGLPMWPAIAVLLAFLRPRRRPLVLVALALITMTFLGCKGTAAASDDELSTCIDDVWLSLPKQCSECADAMAPAECAGGDCQVHSFLWFRGPSHLVHGFVRVSVAAGVFSTSSGAPALDEYTVSGGRLAIEGDGRDEPLAIGCDDERLVWGSSVKHRAPVGAKRSFSTAFDPAGWSHAPYLR